MPRIDEALRRAQTTPASATGVQTPPETTPLAGDAESPWDFDEPALPRANAPAPSTPATEERVAVADAGAPASSRDGAVMASAGTADRATVPERAVGTFQGFSTVVAEKLVVTPEVSSASVEQYRKLAATLHHAQAQRAIRVVLVASAVAGEGKTLTATNLALTFSESYRRRVLLIDADLRRPSLHEVFQIPNVSGLTDGLRSDADQKLSIVQVSECLAVLTAGKPDPDPMSLLTSDRMRIIIEEASERFDWVIVDTPPVGLLPDANLLAALVDVAILVVRSGSTPYSLVQSAVEALGRDRIMGVVLNRVDASTPGVGRYSSYGYGYGYGYGAYGRRPDRR